MRSCVLDCSTNFSTSHCLQIACMPFTTGMIDTAARENDPRCSSMPFWDTNSTVHSISILSLQQCHSTNCSECNQFLEYFNTILGSKELPSDLCFRQRKDQEDASCILWDVETLQCQPRIPVIEILLSPCTRAHVNKILKVLIEISGYHRSS